MIPWEEKLSLGERSIQVRGSIRVVKPTRRVLIRIRQFLIFRDMSWARLTWNLVGQSLRNPAIGVALIRVAWRFRQRGWYTRFPFLPLPAKPYLRWRMH